MKNLAGAILDLEVFRVVQHAEHAKLFVVTLHLLKEETALHRQSRQDQWLVHELLYTAATDPQTPSWVTQNACGQPQSPFGDAIHHLGGERPLVLSSG